IAIDTLDLLENQFGKHSDIDMRRQQIEASRNGVSVEVVTQTISEQTPPVVTSEPESEQVPSQSFAQFEFHTNAEEPAVSPEMVIPASAQPVAETPVTPEQIIDPGLAELF